MRVLVACAFSGIVGAAFRARGHQAYECYILPTEGDYRYHLQEDVRDRVHDGWDMMLCFPPCTHLSVSGARWWKDKREKQAQAICFFMYLAESPVPRIAIENPIGIMSTRYRKPDQIIQPWQFWGGEPGKGETKATCLWLKNLPKLVPTTPNETGRIPRIHRMGPSPTRGQDRSRTYQGIADAMAEQWGKE